MWNTATQRNDAVSLLLWFLQRFITKAEGSICGFQNGFVFFGCRSLIGGLLPSAILKSKLLQSRRLIVLRIRDSGFSENTWS